MPPNPKRRRLSSGVDPAKRDRIAKHQRQLSSEEKDSTNDLPYLQFGLQVAQRLSQLSPNQINFAIPTIDELLRSLQYNLTTLPDLVLLQILDECHSLKDILALCTTTRRLRRLMHERRVWRRYQSMSVEWAYYAEWWKRDRKRQAEECVRIQREGGHYGAGDLFAPIGSRRSPRDRPSPTHQIDEHVPDRIEIPSKDQTKVRQALYWLFKVCRPVQLYFNTHYASVSLEVIADALPPMDGSIKRLNLRVYAYKSREKTADGFRQLMEKMPTQLTCLLLDVVVKRVAGVGPILGRWLRDCSQLQTLGCGELESDKIGVSLLAVLKKHPLKLTTLAFDRMLELVHFNTAATVRHLCFGTERWIDVKCPSPLNERARKNVRSLCCVNGKELPMKFTELPLLFPNCRRISASAYYLSNRNLKEFCTSYRSEHAADEKMEKLQLTLYDVDKNSKVKTSPDPSVVELVLVKEYKWCTVERLFFMPFAIDN